MNRISKKHIYLLLVVLVLSSLAVIYAWPQNESADFEEAEKTSTKQQEVIQEPPTPPVIPVTALLTVPYTVQAPNQSWNLHEESCEEAVVLMYKYFLEGSKKDIPAKTASDAMLKMKAWQKKNYGTEPDLTIEKIGIFAHDYYGLNNKAIKNFNTNDIKKIVSEGSPVIVPVMTHSLNNPNYGPETTYHVLLIKGYNKKGVITNDPGISKGKDYFYSWETLYKAIDAQTPKLKQGRNLLYFL